MAIAVGVNTARLWISDGSLVPFDDVVRLRARHRATLGIPAPYKGAIDPGVMVGAGRIDGERDDDALFAEAEWCVLFPKGIQPYLQEPGRLMPTTPVLMQGLIEGKWLNRLVGTHHWRPATLGNNLLAEGQGIATTLGEMEAGCQGEVIVSYPCRDLERTRVQRTTLADLRGQNVLGLVREVLRYCGETGQDVDGVDLSAMGQTAAVVTERPRITRNLRFRRVPLVNPLNLLHAYAVEQRVVREILAERLGVPSGATVTIVTRDALGTEVGHGTLTLQARQVQGTAQR